MCGLWTTVETTTLLAKVYILHKYHQVFQFLAKCLDSVVQKLPVLDMWKTELQGQNNDKNSNGNNIDNHDPRQKLHMKGIIS